MSVSNREFADKVGIHFSMASRLRNGRRSPSVALAQRICDEFGLATDVMFEAIATGPDAVGALLRRTVFAESEDDKAVA